MDRKKVIQNVIDNNNYIDTIKEGGIVVFNNGIDTIIINNPDSNMFNSEFYLEQFETFPNEEKEKEKEIGMKKYWKRFFKRRFENFVKGY